MIFLMRLRAALKSGAEGIRRLRIKRVIMKQGFVTESQNRT